VIRTFAIALTIAAVLAACRQGHDGPPPPPPPPAAPQGTWVAVRTGMLRIEVPTIGAFRARQAALLGPQVTGRVQEMLVDVGDRVRKDQDVARLDKTSFQIELDQRKADVEAAQVAIAEAELNLARMKNLWEKPDGQAPSVPKKSFDDAVSRHQAALARLKQSAEAVRYAENRVKETVVQAPFDGVVTRRFVDTGESVTSAPVTHILEIQETAVLNLDFSLPQEHLARVREGTRVTFEAEGVDGKAEGTVALVFPDVDEASRSIRCRVVVPNGTGTYRPGLLVRVRVLDHEIPAALLVPKRAVIPAGSGWQVTVRENGKPALRVVRVGPATGDEIQVVEGLAAGDQVLAP